MSNILRIATRNSPLALWQAEHVAGQLKSYYPELTVKIIGMTTRGDQILDSPLSRIGGKGLFVKELETAMLEQRADIAVHSMKDVPMLFPEGLHLSVIMEREDPRDAFVSNHYECLKDLPKGARVGTCSLRRQAQLLAHYPHLTICELRGNIHTRLRKLDQGDYDAIILAASGLIRMDLGERIKTRLSIEESLPAVGQGALGIECRTNDTQVNQWLQALRHQETETRVYCERAMNQRMNGGCQVPIGGYATLKQGQVRLRGLVASPDGSPVYYSEASGTPAEAKHLGEQVAIDLLQQGGQSILANLGVIAHI